MRSELLTRGLLILLGGLLLAAPAHARKRRSLPPVEWGMEVSAAALYNDNLLRFSPTDRNAFRLAAGAYPTPLESLDDLENEIQLHPDIRWRAPWTLMVSADYRLKLVSRLRNSFTNYQTHSFSLGLRPRVSGYRWAARFRAFVIPSFYLRAYRDRDYRQFDAARFSNWDYEGSFRYRILNPLWLEARATYGTYYYNSKFTEYDSEYHDLTAAATYTTPWHFDLAGGYTRRLSVNVGKNQAGALAATQPVDLATDAEYGDSDFHEDEFDVAIIAPLPFVRIVPLQGSLDYRLRRRVYTTNRPLDVDPFHRGRLDRRGAITAATQAQLTQALSAEVYFAYESRHTDSNAPQVVLAKQFIRREFGLVVSYRLR